MVNEFHSVCNTNRSLSALLEFLKTQGRDTSQMLERIHDIIIKTMLSIEPFVTSSVNMFVPYRYKVRKRL